MPYALVFNYCDGSKGEIKPLCCDNPESRHGQEDRKIKRNAQRIADRINRSSNDCKVSVQHYE